ncbi:hypothetical protein CEXT_158971 [Caerostris extrusa]|uniref:Transposase n=1 Tax=Caerostris extrusa TaxID=172846 RepID=A0AAV4XNX0_CAEEX|nr:hypothetical protein CEXT_158971 [Caerostris extrusa]
MERKQGKAVQILVLINKKRGKPIAAQLPSNTNLILSRPVSTAPEDMRSSEFLVNAYEESYNEVPFSEHLHKSVPSTGRTRTEILDMFFTAVKRFTNFFPSGWKLFLQDQQHDKNSAEDWCLRAGVHSRCLYL